MSELSEMDIFVELEYIYLDARGGGLHGEYLKCMFVE